MTKTSQTWVGKGCASSQTRETPFRTTTRLHMCICTHVHLMGSRTWATRGEEFFRGKWLCLDTPFGSRSQDEERGLKIASWSARSGKRTKEWGEKDLPKSCECKASWLEIDCCCCWLLLLTLDDENRSKDRVNVRESRKWESGQRVVMLRNHYLFRQLFYFIWFGWGWILRVKLRSRNGKRHMQTHTTHISKLKAWDGQLYRLE